MAANYTHQSLRCESINTLAVLTWSLWWGCLNDEVMKYTLAVFETYLTWSLYWGGLINEVRAETNFRMLVNFEGEASFELCSYPWKFYSVLHSMKELWISILQQLIHLAWPMPCVTHFFNRRNSFLQLLDVYNVIDKVEKHCQSLSLVLRYHNCDVVDTTTCDLVSQNSCCMFSELS